MIVGIICAIGGIIVGFILGLIRNPTYLEYRNSMTLASFWVVMEHLYGPEWRDDYFEEMAKALREDHIGDEVRAVASQAFTQSQVFKK